MAETLNFNRKYTLSVGNPPVDYKRTGVVAVTGSINGSKTVEPKFTENEYSVLAPEYVLDYRTEYNALEISELHIDVDINKNAKSSTGQGNICSIKVFNLSEDSRTFFCKVGNNVILRAGYDSYDDDELPIIYTGQVESFDVERVGADIITTLICKDGYTPSTAVKVGVYWQDEDYQIVPTSYGDLLRHIAKVWSKNGIKSTKATVVTDQPINYVYDITADELTLGGGYTFQGTLKQLTDEVCQDLGYRWYIDNSIIYIEPKYAREVKTKYTFELSNSQIISIQDQQNNTRSSDNSVGLKIEALLDARFETGKFIRVVDGDKQGTYKITQVTHNLEFRGRKWNTTCICEEVNDD